LTTRIDDIIQPEVFTDYTIKRTMEKSRLLETGIAENNQQFDDLASGPNKLAHMPYWEDLSGEDEVMKDEGQMAVGKIEAEEDIARKHARVKAYGANGLSALLSGDDPMGAIAERYADYWNRRMQEVLLSTLEGIFNGTGMDDKVYDITAATSVSDENLISATTFLDALQKMGDAKDELTGVMMHSAVENYLAKNDLIDYIQPSEGSPRVPVFLNKEVIVDDGVPYDNSEKEGVAYLFGAGAIAWGNGSHPNIQQTETYRDAKAYSGEDVLINRRIFLLHPRGVKWTEYNLARNPGTTGSTAEEELPFPSNAALEEGDNWARVYEPKAIKVVRFEFNIE